LKEKTAKAIDKALDKFGKNVEDTLTENATKAHLTGSLKGYKNLGVIPELDLVRADSIAFAKSYKDLLVGEGATIIKGEKIAWLKDHKKETREKVHDIIQKGLEEGKSPTIGKESIAKELGKVMKDQEYRMRRIARTEIAYIQNKGTVTSYKNNKVTKVQVLDNEGPNSCPECEEANGQIWTLEYAETHELEHPNCVRAFIPIIDDLEPEIPTEETPITPEETPIEPEPTVEPKPEDVMPQEPIEDISSLPAEQRSDFDAKDLDTLDQYSMSDEGMNSLLRGLEEDFTPEQREKAEQMLQDMRRTFEKDGNILKEDVRVFRGVDEQFLKNTVLDMDDGATYFYDPAFLSTSKDISVATDFAISNESAVMGDAPVTVMDILIPEGNRAVYIGNLRQWTQDELLVQEKSMMKLIETKIVPITKAEKKYILEQGVFSAKDIPKTKKVYVVKVIDCLAGI
jgi:SPP1 gp7 family putative phage head morphogenesis protein